jgi:hypothetical protein
VKHPLPQSWSHRVGVKTKPSPPLPVLSARLEMQRPKRCRRDSKPLASGPQKRKRGGSPLPPPSVGSWVYYPDFYAQSILVRYSSISQAEHAAFQFALQLRAFHSHAKCFNISEPLGVSGKSRLKAATIQYSFLYYGIKIHISEIPTLVQPMLNSELSRRHSSAGALNEIGGLVGRPFSGVADLNDLPRFRTLP